MNKIKLISILLLLIIGNSGFTQTQIDSLLLAREHSIHDTLKIKTDIKLGLALEMTNFDSALFYYHQALNLSKQEHLDSFPHFEGLVLGNIGFAYIYGKKETDKGINLLKQASQSHHQHGLINEVLKTQYNIGFFYASLANYDSAIQNYNKVINKNLERQTKIRLHESYNNAGLVYFYQGEFAKSADYLIKAIRLKEQTGQTNEIYDTYVNLGIAFQNLDEYERAKHYFLSAISILEKTELKYAKAESLRNLGHCLVEQDSLDLGENYYQQAYAIYKDAGSKIRTSFYHYDLGKIHELKGEIKKSHDSYQKALDEFPERVTDRYSANAMLKLARTKIALTEMEPHIADKNQLIDDAIRLGEEAWKRAKRSGATPPQLLGAKVLRDAYQKAGKYKKSLIYSIHAFELTNEINARHKLQAISRVTMEYETERIETENNLLEEKQRAQSAQLTQQRTLLITGLILLFLLVIIGVISYWSRQRLKKANKKIEHTLSEKVLLLKEIHHRVKNNLQVISSLLDLQSRKIKNEETLSTFLEGQSRVKAMALIHQKLYQHENLAAIDFTGYSEQLMKELAIIYPSAKNVKTSIHANDGTLFDIDTAVPLGLILNELISNAYKYAFGEGQEGKLSIAVTSLGEGKHQLTVADTGSGLPKGFDFNKAKSLGLRLVKRLSKQLYGTVDYYGEQGAKFVITFTDTIQRKAI